MLNFDELQFRIKTKVKRIYIIMKVKVVYSFNDVKVVYSFNDPALWFIRFNSIFQLRFIKALTDRKMILIYVHYYPSTNGSQGHLSESYHKEAT